MITDPNASADEKIVAGIQGAMAVGTGGKGKTKAPRSIRNSHLARSYHPVTGVPFDKKGFPDFSGHLYQKNGKGVDVRITPTGNRIKDYSAANAAAKLKETPEGYIWHHHQQTGRMQLVEEAAHSLTGHTGGFYLWEIAK